MTRTWGFSKRAPDQVPSSAGEQLMAGPSPETDLVIDLRAPSGAQVTGLRRVLLGGCAVDLVMADDLWRLMDGHLGRPRGTGCLLVASANLDHLAHFGELVDGDDMDPGHMDDWLVLLDGIPLVQVARRLTGTAYPRLAGADLLPDFLGLAESRQSSVAVLGGSPALREPLAAAMARQWPRLNLVCHLTPPRDVLLDEQACRRIQQELASHRVDLLVVALGKPLQEQWIAKYANGTGALVAVAFGAAVDFMAGTIPRAPRWMRDHGLEWAYRLAREPRRLSRRYLVQSPRALRMLYANSAIPALPRPAADPQPAEPRIRADQ